MVNSYIGSDGKRVQIQQMPDAHLLNAYAKRNKILKHLESLQNHERIAPYIQEQREILDSLKQEIERRELLGS
jgi:hypothetical protein